MKLKKIPLLANPRLYPPQTPGGPPVQLTTLGVIIPLVGIVPQGRGLTLDEMRPRAELLLDLEEQQRIVQAAASDAPAYIFLRLEHYQVLHDLLHSTQWTVVDPFILELVASIDAAEEVDLEPKAEPPK